MCLIRKILQNLSYPILTYPILNPTIYILLILTWNQILEIIYIRVWDWDTDLFVFEDSEGDLGCCLEE